MNITTVTSYFKPRLEMSIDQEGRTHATDTTGDTVDPELTLYIPKSQAQEGGNEKGQEFLAIARGDKTAWVPKQAFTVSDGPNGVYYLPTFQDSAKSAVIGGAVRGLISLGPLGLASGAVGGFVGSKAGDNAALKLSAGAAAGAVALALPHGLIFGAQGLPVAAFLGAVSGLGATAAGSGQARIRDAVYGGTLAGFAAGLATGMPLTLLTGSAAAALGAQANSKPGQVITGGLAGAALGAAQAALTHGPIGLAAGIGAAVGAAGPLLGQPLMQLSRNLADDGGHLLRKTLGPWVQRQSDTTLSVVWGLPFAVSGGLIGSAASALGPGLGMPGAVVGSVLGGALGVYQGHQLIAKMKARSAQAAAAQVAADQAAVTAPAANPPAPKAA